MLKRGEWVNCGSEYHLFVLLLLFRGQLDPLSSKCGISSIAKIEISVLFYEHCYWAPVEGAYIVRSTAKLPLVWINRREFP